jgi:ubiquinone/menaquinone biosynthesis C-methylase UbiE
VVLDIACGTGINFEAIEAAIGPTGQLIGVDVSPDMLAIARARVASHGWQNVVLCETPAEALNLNVRADAALFSLAHDVLQSPAAMATVWRHLKPAARVAAFGAKRPPLWHVLGRLVVWLRVRQYMTTSSGLDRPWSTLERFVPALAVESVARGSAFIAWGTSAARPSSGNRSVSQRRSPSPQAVAVGATTVLCDGRWR